MRHAGWPDDKPVWTGSCPCQPFSAAGKGAGFDDERHLWPAFQWLIQQQRPPVVFGEQVGSKAVDAWIDLVHADLEAMGYAFGSIPFPSAGVGAPHIRDRNYWVADANGRQQPRQPVVRGLERDGDDAGRAQSFGEFEPCGDVFGLANTSNIGFNGRRSGETSNGQDSPRLESERLCDVIRPGPTNGHWRDADWLLCRDGKWRPVRPGSFPLAHGVSNRVGRLRGYGNAINPIQAAEFVGSFMEIMA
ncbi:MAG: DNA cytosine methyltransferase [Porticoccaceae bacterium]|nr:DNA cytosine methyltransferase [Porticoccaceae bacterium]